MLLEKNPDVLAFDPALHTVYIAAESGPLTMFSDGGGTVQRIGQQDVGPDAHSIAVDPDTHHLYVPPQNLNGQPVLRSSPPRARSVCPCAPQVSDWRPATVMSAMRLEAQQPRPTCSRGPSAKATSAPSLWPSTGRAYGMRARTARAASGRSARCSYRNMAAASCGRHKSPCHNGADSDMRGNARVSLPRENSC